MAEERAVIAKESALIRTSFKDQDTAYRHRNVAKLLFIHMLGYPSYFGQLECIKLIASSYFPEKRIGYLGLLLLNQNNEEDVLTLVTNSLKNDLNHSNPYVCGLSLTAVGNIASADMSRDLAIDIDKHLANEKNEFLRKKAALAAIRIFRKVPELMEDFQDRVLSMVTKSRNHGVLLTSIQLVIDMIDLDKELASSVFQKVVPNLVRHLRHLLSVGYVPEYDVSGIADPFLQVKILQLMRRLGKDNEEASEAMNDVLAQVATNTETAKNAGNAILYECVQTIMAIESESGLRVLAINILGRFLLNRDNNIRYVALNTLSKVVAEDVSAVQRHRNTIVECLKDPDNSIRTRALELIYALVNESNIQMLARELLNYLVSAPEEKHPELCTRIADTVERYAPSCRWHIDTLISMLSIAGGSVSEDESLSSSLIALIQQNPSLHSYVVHKLYWAIKDDISNSCLVHVGIWCVGEYGAELTSDPPSGEDTLDGKYRVPEEDIVDLLKKFLKTDSEMTQAYVLTAMLKLTSRLNSTEQNARLVQSLRKFKNSMVLELQQRSCEYTSLMDSEWDSVRPDVLLKMPAINAETIRARKVAVFSDDEDGNDFDEEKPTAGKATTVTSQPTNLLDLDDIFAGGSSSTSSSNNTSSSAAVDIFGTTTTTANAATPSSSKQANNSVDLLSDIFSGNPSAAAAAPPSAAAPAAASGSNDLMGLMGFGSTNSSNKQSIKGYEKGGLVMNCEIWKPNPNDPSTTHILAKFTNSNSAPLENFVFQSAFPKYIKLLMEPPSSNVVPAKNAGEVTQLVKIQNSLHGQKPVMMRLKIQFVANGNKIDDVGVVESFPKDF